MYNKTEIMDMLSIIFYEIILGSKNKIYILYTVSNVFDTLAVDHNAHAIAKAYPNDELY